MKKFTTYTESDHTFVLCAYKENRYIENTIASLRAQTVQSSILLSTSTPNGFLEDVCARHSIQMVINPSPNLAGDDWNYGYDKARTPLVTLAHQDDLYEPKYLEEFLRTINEYPSTEVAMVFSDYYELRNSKKQSTNTLLKIKRFMNSPFGMKLFNGSRFVKRRVLSFGNSICCPSVMYVKPVIGDTVFDTSFKNSCDYKTYVDLASRKGRFVYIPSPLIGHRIYEESATSKNIGENIRIKEDEEILALLWPKLFARIINRFYVRSEKSNELK